jgi:dTDP-4-dehydrorhamnose 3,5-epimerase
MNVTHLDIKGLLLIEPKLFGDDRGLFSEVFKADVFDRIGFKKPFIQDNLARSTMQGVIRGLHFQREPFSQDKLVRCSAGSIFDVAVDLRPTSPTFGRHHAVILSAQNWLQFFVPAGFAHGYCTLEANTEVNYKVTAPYAPEYEGGILWNDPALGIEWPVLPSKAIVNRRDEMWPPLEEVGERLKPISL